MKYNIISSDWISKSGTSKVTIGTKLGHFTGVAHLHESDEDIKSMFIGGDIATLNAVIKHYYKEIQITRYQLKTLREVKDTMIKTLDSSNEGIKIVNSKIKSLDNHITSIKQDIANVYNEKNDIIKTAKIFAERKRTKPVN